VRWFIPGDVVRRVLVGAETATLFARFEVAGAGWLASVPLPIAPAALAALSEGRVAPPAAVAAAAPQLEPADAPARLLVRSANPLRRGGSLAFGVPAAGRVRLTFVDAAGRRVATLVDGARDAGWHATTLPPSLDAGVYFAVVERTGERAVMRIVVLP
ncbi:MAG: hypothetical protein ABIP29_05365, partial [Candidatus Eisenbacteria bacterium]